MRWEWKEMRKGGGEKKGIVRWRRKLREVEWCSSKGCINQLKLGSRGITCCSDFLFSFLVIVIVIAIRKRS